LAGGLRGGGGLLGGLRGGGEGGSGGSWLAQLLLARLNLSVSLLGGWVMEAR
jgi:hypothetical protein